MLDLRIMNYGHMLTIKKLNALAKATMYLTKSDNFILVANAQGKVLASAWQPWLSHVEMTNELAVHGHPPRAVLSRSTCAQTIFFIYLFAVHVIRTSLIESSPDTSDYSPITVISKADSINCSTTFSCLFLEMAKAFPKHKC